MSEFTLTFEGFDKALEFYGQKFEGQLIEATRIAINDTARWSISERGIIRRDMQDNINFPSGYINKDRLNVSKFASDNSLEAQIYARGEPTSLARFAVDAGAKAGIMVHVKTKGGAKMIPKGFLYGGLKRGDVRKGNSGLVVRSESKPKGGYRPKQIGSTNLWLLYGPSIYQVFANSMHRLNPAILDKLTDNFDRQVARLVKP